MSNVQDPEDTEVRFHTTNLDKGVVHVFDRFVDGAEYKRYNMPFNPWMRMRCGLLRREQDIAGIGTFKDERLCRRCGNATPEAERHTLFEHPQVDDEPL